MKTINEYTVTAKISGREHQPQGARPWWKPDARAFRMIHRTRILRGGNVLEPNWWAADFVNRLNSQTGLKRDFC